MPISIILWIVNSNLVNSIFRPKNTYTDPDDGRQRLLIELEFEFVQVSLITVPYSYNSDALSFFYALSFLCFHVGMLYLSMEVDIATFEKFLPRFLDFAFK